MCDLDQDNRENEFNTLYFDNTSVKKYFAVFILFKFAKSSVN